MQQRAAQDCDAVACDSSSTILRAAGEAALLDAVRSGQVASAGLDSFAVEPMTAPHPFHAEARITLSPHIGGVTSDAYVKMGVAATQNALAVLNA
jgi:D-3-phosphoglycerate dehydrogenase